MRQDPKEVSYVSRFLIRSRHSFFATACFEKLKEHGDPKLFEGRGADGHRRILGDGLRLAEEVLSVSMLIRNMDV